MLWRRTPPPQISPRFAAAEGRVRAAIDAFRPYLRADGGDVEFLGIDDAGVVRVRLRGACHGCPCSATTLSDGLERHIREQVPEIRAVEAAP